MTGRMPTAEGADIRRKTLAQTLGQLRTGEQGERDDRHRHDHPQIERVSLFPAAGDADPLRARHKGGHAIAVGFPEFPGEMVGASRAVRPNAERATFDTFVDQVPGVLVGRRPPKMEAGPDAKSEAEIEQNADRGL